MNLSLIEELQEIDNELIIDVLEKPLSQLFSLIHKVPIPKTFEAISMLQLNISFLKTGIFDLALADNNYGMAVLERALYEHWVKHFYLFIQYCKCKDDSAGIEYYKWTDIKEYIDYFNSLKKKQELEKAQNKIETIESIIEEVYSGYAEIPKSDRSNNLSNLSFYRLLKKIMTDLTYRSKILTELPSDYSILSSFVHGGPHANRLQMFNSSSEKEREKTLYKGCKKAYLFSIMCLTNTFIIAGQYDKSLLKYVEIVKEYVNKVPDDKCDK